MKEQKCLITNIQVVRTLTLEMSSSEGQMGDLRKVNFKCQKTAELKLSKLVSSESFSQNLEINTCTFPPTNRV